MPIYTVMLVLASARTGLGLIMAARLVRSAVRRDARVRNANRRRAG
jgi:hypothetical protein